MLEQSTSPRQRGDAGRKAREGCRRKDEMLAWLQLGGRQCSQRLRRAGGGLKDRGGGERQVEGLRSEKQKAIGKSQREKTTQLFWLKTVCTHDRLFPRSNIPDRTVEIVESRS